MKTLMLGYALYIVVANLKRLLNVQHFQVDAQIQRCIIAKFCAIDENQRCECLRIVACDFLERVFSQRKTILEMRCAVALCDCVRACQLATNYETDSKPATSIVAVATRTEL